MVLPTFEKTKLIGLVAILSFGLTSLFAVLLPEVLSALVPATFILGFFVLIPLVLLLGDEFPLVEPADLDGESASSTAATEDPLATLRERYASGEIDEEEFERRLDRLLETEELDDRTDAGAAGRREPPGRHKSGERREREPELE